MNPIEMALQSWREQKTRYEKVMKTIVADLSRPIKFIPSPSFQAKEEEIKEHLRYNYAYQEDDSFDEVYVHHIAGVLNMTLMELANKLVGDIGGNIKFWQNKIVDLASNTTYHPELSIWEVNRAFQKYMGLQSHYTFNLRKKRSLSRQYLSYLIAICKQIDKSKGTQQDLLKLDESFKKLKKAEQKYYAFLEEIEDLEASKTSLNVSLKGKTQARNNLFFFLKAKEEKVNTLVNYNFRIQRNSNNIKQSKLLKGRQYDDFSDLFKSLSALTKSQRQSAYSQASESGFPITCKDIPTIPIQQLRSQFDTFLEKEPLEEDPSQTEQKQFYVFIWSKQYFFTYWGYPVRHQQSMNPLQPFDTYDSINYEIASEDEFDELNAEDVGSDGDSSSEESISNGSFVVDDDFVEEGEGEGEGERDLVSNYKQKLGYDRWIKQSNDLQEYEFICLYSEEKELFLNEEDQNNGLEEAFLDKLEGKSRVEIMNIFQVEKKDYSKNRIQTLLKSHFTKSKTKQGKITYTKVSKSDPSCKEVDFPQTQGFSDQETTHQLSEMSMPLPSRSITRSNRVKSETMVKGSLKMKNPPKLSHRNNETILQEDVMSQDK